MDNSEFKIANAALKTLPSYEEKDFEQWFRSEYSGTACQADSQKAFAIIEYDFDKRKNITLPAAYAQLSSVVNNHLSSTSQNDPWGLVDDNLVILKLSDQPYSRSGRLLLFRIDFVATLLEKLFPDEQITPGELKLLLQTLSGLTLKQAAATDSVSTETKKSQLTSLFNKTGIRKQQALSNFLISHLLMEVAASHSRRQSSNESDQMFFDYVDNFMGSYVRASVVQESPDRRFRIIEIGHPAGTPVVCIHHLGLINFSESEIAEIQSQGIRLICPLRHGAIGPLDEKISPIQYLEHTLSGIDLAVSLVPEKKVTIIGLLSGCMYAHQYQKYYPAKLDKLIFFGASFKPETQAPSNSAFKTNLHELASDHEEMLGATVSYMLDKVDKPQQLKKVMEESHNNGAADMSVISDLFSDEKQVMAMQHRLKHSTNSILQDLRTQALTDWGSLINNESKAPTHFIHGSADKLIPIKNIRNLVENNANYHLHVVLDAGNWIFGKFTRRTFSIVRSILDH